MIKNICNLKIQDDESQDKRLHRLKFIVSFGKVVSEEEVELAKRADLSILTFAEVIEQGKKEIESFTVEEPKPADCFMLCYTSGTTGDPKGVKLTQRMFAIAVQNNISSIGDQ